MEMTMKAKVDSCGKMKAFLSVVLTEISELFPQSSKFLLLLSKSRLPFPGCSA